MIRPITVLTFILACGSGMYLYQAKHRVHLLDEQIDLAVHQTEAVRGQSRALHAEWMLLNDPDRLHRLAAHYLVNLQAVAPTQFTDLADLDGRLPPVGPAPGDTANPVVAAVAAPGATAPVTATEGVPGSQRPATDAAAQREGGTIDQAHVDQASVDQASVTETGAGRASAGQVGADPAAGDAAAIASRAAEPSRGVAANRAVASARTTERSPQPTSVRTPGADRPARPAIARSGPAARTPQPVIAQARPVGYAPARSVIAQVPRPASRAAETWPARAEPFRAEPAAARMAPRMPAWRPSPPRAVTAAAAPSRFAASAQQRPMPPMRPQSTPGTAAYGGSMLGMAHAGASLPRPMPLNAAYNNINSGG